MMDGLSSGQRPVPGFASALLEILGSDRGQVSCFLQRRIPPSRLPFALYPNLPLDIIEALTYGPEWQLASADDLQRASRQR